MDKTKTLMSTPPAGTRLGLSSYVASEHSAFTAPNALAQGAAVPFAGTSAAVPAAQVAVAGARVIDLPGSPPRGAPV